MKFKQLLLCAIAITLPLSVNAASKKNTDRWFEVEVILFNQLGDKSQLKESFPDHSELPKYRRSTDLLARYLNPDIASLKQLLPHCDSPQYQPDLASQKAKLPALFSEKSLVEISQLSSLSQSLQPESSATLHKFTNTEDADTTDSFSDDTAMLRTDTLNQQHNIEAPSPFKNDLIAELSDEDHTAIQALVLAAEVEFTQLKFQYTQKPTSEASAKYSQEVICRIDEKHFAEIKANDASFNYNGFSVDKIPLQIDAIENLASNSTHLLSKGSLKLGDVITDLRYSKNFRPLLHMGWRQVARPKKLSVPVKIYAGDNFSADYKKQLTQYQADKDQLNSSAIALKRELNTLPLEDAQAKTLLFAQAVAQAKKARIASIVEEISTVTDNTELLLNSIENDDLSLTIIDKAAQVSKEKVAPIPPVQDWFLNGFFNIHLKHYLFITADFNILDKSLAELATAQLAGSTVTNTQNSASDDASLEKLPSLMHAKAIRFKQNRRVISGEVHYFDHPYIGMIVQIRPYKKPVPEESD